MFKSRSVIVGSATIAIVLVLWLLVTSTYLTKQVLPSPMDVARSAATIGLGNLGDHTFATTLRVVAGWCLGCLLGVRMGLLMSRFPLFREVTTPIIEAIRPIPPIALIPFFLIWFGIGWSGQVLLISLGCFMVMTINTLVAVNNVPEIYIRAAAALGASRGRIFRSVIRPAILPDLISGYRIAAALAFALGIAAELMGAQSGLGFVIAVARRSLDTSTIFLAVILTALVASVFDQLIKIINERRCRWHKSSRTSIERTSSLIRGAI